MIEYFLEFIKDPKKILIFLVNAPVYYLYYKIIFGDSQNLGDSFKQSSQIDIVSFCQGNLLDDWWHTAKIICWVFLCYKTVNMEYLYIFN
jgi:hypothetical protein